MTNNRNTIVYNVTFKVHWNIADAWLDWQKKVHIPAHLATGSFDDYKIYRLLDQDEEEGPTFIIQYFTDSEKRYQDFLIDASPGLQQQAWSKWGEGFIAFRTLMREP